MTAEEKWKILDDAFREQWEKRVYKPIHAAAYSIDPRFSDQPTQELEDAYLFLESYVQWLFVNLFSVQFHSRKISYCFDESSSRLQKQKFNTCEAQKAQTVICAKIFRHKLRITGLTELEKESCRILAKLSNEGNRCRQTSSGSILYLDTRNVRIISMRRTCVFKEQQNRYKVSGKFVKIEDCESIVLLLEPGSVASWSQVGTNLSLFRKSSLIWNVIVSEVVFSGIGHTNGNKHLVLSWKIHESDLLIENGTTTWKKVS